MKKRFVIIGAALLLSTASGAVTLKIVNSNGGGTSSAVDIEDESLLNKYISLPDKKVNEFLSEDSSNNYKNILFATTTKFAKESKYIVTSSLGNVEASVAGIPYNQEVSTRRIINENDTFFQTNTISTFVKKSEQRYTNSNSYLVREGSNPTIDGADYSSSRVEALSKKDYMNRYGHTNRDIFNYAINDVSFLNGVYEGQKEDGLYYFTFTLDPTSASAAYVREVSYMAGSSSYPIFSDIHFNIAINNDYEIQKSTINEVYTTPILGGLNCSGVFNETYTYYTSNIDCPEKEYFSPYFGQETGEIEKEKTAMDYLSSLGDDLSKFNNLAFKGKINVNDEELNFKIKLDLSSSSYYVSINDALDIIYLDSKAYVITNSSSYLVTKDELDKVIYLVSGNENLFSSDTLMALMENPFVSKIVSSMNVSKEEKFVDINIPFSDESKIVLHLYEDNDSISIIGLDANLIYESYTLTADFEVVNESTLTFKEIPPTVKEITNISPIVTKVKDIVDKKAFYGEINFEKEFLINETKLPLKINGSYYVSLKDKDNPLYKFDLKININNTDIPVVIDGNKEKLYLKIGDSLVTNISYEELINILNRFVTFDNKLPNIEINQIFNTLFNVIDNLDFYEDYIEFNLDSLKINLLNGTIKLSYNENLLLSYNDSLSISLLPYEDDLIEVTYEESLDLNILTNELLSYIENGYYNVNINNLTFNDVNLNGEINVKPNLTNLDESLVKGTLEITYQNITGNISFYYVDKKIYLTLNDNSKVYLSLDEIKELLNEYVPDFNLSEINLSNVNILSIINSIKTSGNEIKLDLNDVTSSKFNYELVISLARHNIKLVSLDTLNEDIILKQGETFSTSINESEYVNLKPVISSLNKVYSLVSKQDVSTYFSLDCLYNSSTYRIEGELSYKKIDDNNFIFFLEITSPLEIKISYLNETFYLDIESSHIKFNKASLKHVLSEIKDVYSLDEETISLILNILDNGLDIISSLNVDPSSLVLNINNLFNGIYFSDDDIIIDLNLNQFVNDISSLKINISSRNSSLEEITLNDILLNKVSLKNITLNNLSSSKEISVNNEDSYLDLSSLSNLSSIKEIKDLISNKVYSLELHETSFEGGSVQGNISYLDLSKLDLSLLNTEVIRIEDIINDISLSGEFIIKIDNLNEPIRLKVNLNNGIIQVKLLDNNYSLVIGGTYSELVDILDNVKTTLGTTLSNLIKDLDLSKIVLPLEIESTLSEISIDTIITYLKEISLNDIIKYFDVSNVGKIDLRLNLSSLNSKLNEVNILYYNSSLDVNISSLTSLTLSSRTKVDDFDNEFGEVTTLSLINLTNELLSYIENGYYNVNINNLTFNDVNLNGEINVKPNLTNLDESLVKGTLEITYQNITGNISFYYVDKKIYLTLNDNSKVYLSLDEIKELLNEYVPDFNLSEINLSNVNILSIINSIKTSGNEIKLDLNDVTSSKFNYELVISLARHNIKLVSLDTLNEDIILKQGETFSTSINESEYVNLKPVISSLNKVYSLVSKQDVSTYFSLDCLYNSSTYRIEGELSYKKIDDNNFIFFLEITSPLEIKISYLNETFYLDIESSHIKFNKASLKHVLSEIKDVYSLDEETISLILNILDNGLDIISSLNVDPSSLVLNINNLFNGIYFSDDDIIIDLNLNQFVNDISSLKINISSRNSSLEEITLNDILLNKVSLKNITLNNLSSSKEISVNNEDSYLDLSSLSNLSSIKEIKDLISNKVYSLELHETSFEGGSVQGNISYLDLSKLDLSLLNTEVIRIEDIINDISLSGEFIIKIDNLNEPIRLKVNLNNGIIQVKLLDNNYSLVIGGTYSELVDILDNVKTTLGTTLSNLIKDLDLSKIVLPLEIESTLSEISIDTIITYLKEISLNDIIKYFDVSNVGKIDLRLNLSSLNSKLNEVNILYYNSSLDVNISSLTSLTLSSRTKVDDFDNEFGEVTTCSFENITDLVSSLSTLLETRKFDGFIKLDNLAFNLNVKDVVSLLGLNISSEDTIRMISNISIYYQIDFSNALDFYLDIAFDIKNVPSDSSKGGNISFNTEHLIITKVNKDIYFKLSNIVSCLTYEEWLEVIKYLEDSLSLDFNINYSNVNEIIDELSNGLDSFISYIISKKENNSSSNITSYIDVNKIITSLNYVSLNNNESEISFVLSLQEIASKYSINFVDLSSIDVNLNTKEGKITLNSDFELNLFYKNNYSSLINEIEASNYVTCSSLMSVIDQIVSLKNTFKQNKFVISTSSSTSSNYVSKDNKKLFDYSGKIVLSLEDEIKFNINNVTLNAYQYDNDNNVTTSTHNFSLAYLPTYTKNGEVINKDSLFINYGPNLKGYLSRSEFASLAQYGCDLMGINSSVIKALLTNLGSAESLDTNVLSSITDGTKLPNININLDNLFDSYIISQNDSGSEFEINLNAKDIYTSLYGEDFNKDNENENKNIVSLKVCSSKDKSLISKVKLENMYSSSCEVFNIDLDISNTFSEEETSLLNIVDVTNDNNELGKYYYLGNIPTLLKAFVNTANLRKYHVSGSLSMNLGKWNLQNITYDIKIVLDENNKPYIEVTFNANYFFLVMDGGQSKLLYSPTEEKVYLRNNKSKKNRVYTFVESDSNYIGNKENIAEIINIILGSKSTISGTIESSVSNTNPNIDINTILKNYSYNYDESTLTGLTNVTLDGSQLMSSLSNLNVHLTNQEVDMQIDENNIKHGDYLTSFTFDTSMSVITLSGNGTFNNINETTSNITVDLDLISKAVNNSSTWSF